MFQLNAVPKPQFKRNKPTAKQRGYISPSVRQKVNERAGDKCERCYKNRNAVWTLEQAHLTRRWQIEGKTTEYDLALLCGPSTQSGTCHHWADSTREGREWLSNFKNRLLEEAK